LIPKHLPEADCTSAHQTVPAGAAMTLICLKLAEPAVWNVNDGSIAAKPATVAPV
jgi:hypothetical protein